MSVTERKFGKLIKEDKGNYLYKFINMGYSLFMIVKDFSFRMLWFGSCVGLMFVFPMSFEMFNEQQKILMRIQMSEMMSAGMD